MPRAVPKKPRSQTRRPPIDEPQIERLLREQMMATARLEFYILWWVNSGHPPPLFWGIRYKHETLVWLGERIIPTELLESVRPYLVTKRNYTSEVATGLNDEGLERLEQLRQQTGGFWHDDSEFNGVGA